MHSSTPKVLHRLAGRAMLSHVFDTAKQLSPKVVCVVYGHGGEHVRQAVGENGAVWVMQEPQLGTGHAVMQAAPHLDERWPTLVLYGDVPLIRAETLKELVQATGKGLGLLTATLDSPAGYGRILRNGKKVVAIVEEKDANARQRALREINTGIVVAIDVNCVFEGKVELGDRVSVGANCVVKDVTVAASTRIEPFCHLEDADIGTGCRIGPYARIRPGTRTRLAAEVHIGNFVEVKASSIGAGSKANHLSYIGDSDVGSNVNVGAGTIVCNYDGANKHRTII